MSKTNHQEQISERQFKSLTKKIHSIMKEQGVDVGYQKTLEIVSNSLYDTSYRDASKSKLRKSYKLKLTDVSQLFIHPICLKQMNSAPEDLKKEYFKRQELIHEKDLEPSEAFLFHYSYFYRCAELVQFGKWFQKGEYEFYVRFVKQPYDNISIDIGEIDGPEGSYIRSYGNSNDNPLPDEVLSFLATVLSVHSTTQVYVRYVENDHLQSLLKDTGAKEVKVPRNSIDSMHFCYQRA